MIKDNTFEFADLFCQLALMSGVNYDKEKLKEMMNLYFETLLDIPITEIRIAVKRMLKEFDFHRIPSAGLIRQWATMTTDDDLKRRANKSWQHHNGFQKWKIERLSDPIVKKIIAEYPQGATGFETYIDRDEKSAMFYFLDEYKAILKSGDFSIPEYKQIEVDKKEDESFVAIQDNVFAELRKNLVNGMGKI